MTRSPAYAALLAFCVLGFAVNVSAPRVVAQEPAAAATPREYEGRLAAELVPDTAFIYGPRLRMARRADIRRLPFRLAKADRAAAGTIDPPGYGKMPLDVLLVEQAGAAPRLFVDLDRDKRFAAREGFAFAPSSEPDTDGEMTIRLSAPVGGRFATLPILLRLPKPTEPEGFFMLGKDGKPADRIEPAPDASKRELHFSHGFFAVGTVNIDRRSVLVRYSYDLAKGTIDPRNGTHGMDSDLDGAIDTDSYTPESARVRGEQVVFRVGARFFSTQSLDLASGRVVLREHPPADYRRIELVAGALMPDFEFKDFENRARRLSDYHGKFVLLDFWGAWCPPCVAELPHLKEAYARFRTRGFEIVGMNIETTGKNDQPLATDADYAEKLTEMREFVRCNEIGWTQATTASIRELTRRRLRINVFPTTILLDPEGRILSTGGAEMPLRGDDLMKTLVKILPTTN